MEITFPNYFDNNNKFASAAIQQNKFVNYVHNLDSIQNVQLSIDQRFMLFVFRGEVKLTATDKTYFVSENKAVIVRKGAYIMSEALSKSNNSFRAFLFFLSDDLIEKFCYEQNITSNNPSIQKSLIPLEVDPSLQNYVNSIVLLLSKEKITLSEDLLTLKAKELLHLLYSSNQTEELKCIFCQKKRTKEFQIKQVVEANLSQGINIKQLAFLCGMSLSNFKRKFTDLYGCSPAKWIKEKRLDLASHLLETTDQSIADISDSTGFSSPSYFVQAFKQQYNKKPSDFRR